MYYMKEIRGKHFIFHNTNTDVILGPFDSYSDAYFVEEMLNTNVLTMEADINGEKDIEEPNTIHEHAPE